MRLDARNNPVLEENGKVVEVFDCFQYLGIIVTADGGAKEDVRSRNRKANFPFETEISDKNNKKTGYSIQM